MERAQELVPIEIKSAQTIHSDFFTSLSYFCEIANIATSTAYVIYGGGEDQQRQAGRALSWKRLPEIIRAKVQTDKQRVAHGLDNLAIDLQADLARQHVGFPPRARVPRIHTILYGSPGCLGRFEDIRRYPFLG